MKILLISPLPPPAGGIATWTELYINSNEVKNNYVQVVDTSVKGNRVGNFVKKSLKDEIKRTLSIYSEIKNSLSNDKFDIAHFNTSCSKLGMVRDFLCARKVKGKVKKLIIHCHCDTSYMVNGRFAEYFFKKLCKLGDIVFCLNKASQNHIKEVASKNSIIIPNFFDVKALKNILDKIISEKINTVIFVGHIIKTKGCDDIIVVAKQLPDITFKLIGHLSDEIKEMTYTGNVKFVGEMSKENVIKQMHAADVLLFPTHTEGFPYVVLEAMACGLPVISTPVGAIPDMIGDKGGAYISINDVNGIIKAIADIQNKDVRAAMSQWNINKVKSSYLTDVVLKRIFSLYEDK